jgi:hypothetical protein
LALEFEGIVSWFVGPYLLIYRALSRVL